MIDYDGLASAISPEQLAQAIGARKAKGGGPGAYHCPRPERHQNADADPSCSIFTVEGRTGLRCHGCELAGSPVTVAAELWGCSLPEAAERLAEEIGFRPSGNGGRGDFEIEEEYSYTDENGAERFQVVRLTGKGFLQRHRCPQGRDGWTWNLGGKTCVCPRTPTALYRLSAVIPVAREGGVVWIPEGEKDADRLASLGLPATTNPGGATGKWLSRYSESLAGAHCFILPDDDQPGREHAQEVARALHGVAKSVKLVALAGLPDKGDVSDWLDAGHDVQELLELAKKPDWTPLSGGGDSRSSDGTADTDQDILPPPGDPMAVSRVFVKQFYTDGDDFVLRTHRGDFYGWDGSCWPEAETRRIRGETYRWLESAVFGQATKNGIELVPWHPTRHKIDNVLDALKAVTHLDGTVESPSWLRDDPSDVPASEIVGVVNGLLHIPTRTLLPHTPRFWAHHALPYAYETPTHRCRRCGCGFSTTCGAMTSRPPPPFRKSLGT
jgi:hypothetical protein